MLAWTIYASFLGALALILLPGSRAAWARIIALLTTLVTFAITLTAFIEYRTGELLTVLNGDKCVIWRQLISPGQLTKSARLLFRLARKSEM